MGHGDSTVVTARSFSPENSRLPTRNSQRYSIRAGDREALLPLKLPGAFNLQNALAAIAVGISQGIELARITRELAEVERIPGRMDRVEAGQPFMVLIDYAVTPAAFAALYAEIRQTSTPHSPLLTPARQIIHVFGATGERDRGKRPLLGEIAGRNADVVILADEDPFSENPERILDEIDHGLRVAGAHFIEEQDMTHLPFRESDIVYYTTSKDTPGRGGDGRPERASGRAAVLRIRDRRLAIREALRRAQAGDVVLVTGKGAEETMAVGSKRIPWNDRRVIEEELRALSGRATKE